MHVMNLRMGVDSGSNTFAELLILWGLLRFTKKRGLLQHNIFGDSKIVINWENGLNSLQSLRYGFWMRRIVNLKKCFHSIAFKHIYTIFNSDVDSLSKLSSKDCSGVLYFVELLALWGLLWFTK